MSDLDQDIVAVGLDLEPETLIKAYSNGVFPWPSPGLPLLWYCPHKRAILPIESLHVGKRLKQSLLKAPWTFTLNQAFSEVIEACSERGDEGTWITPAMKTAYLRMHQLGHAHSVEVWKGQDSKILVGGLYGIDMAGTFAGESMFHREDNASKAAILFICFLLKSLGRAFMDIQVMTPHLEALGAQEISRSVFLKRLKALQENLPQPLRSVGLQSRWKLQSPFEFIIADTLSKTANQD